MLCWLVFDQSPTNFSEGLQSSAVWAHTRSCRIRVKLSKQVQMLHFQEIFLSWWESHPPPPFTQLTAIFNSKDRPAWYQRCFCNTSKISPLHFNPKIMIFQSGSEINHWFHGVLWQNTKLRTGFSYTSGRQTNTLKKSCKILKINCS